jgi:site-specific DNA-methyltransferase (adenine-specific)
MMVEPVHIGDATLYEGDCLDILPTLGNVDAVVTDPPYPDYHQTKYKYDANVIASVVGWIAQRPALIFWSAKHDLDCNHSAIHIWDKKTGCGSEYERIYELNGQRNYKVVSSYLINSTVAASFTGDEFNEHPSQKPIALLRAITGWLNGKIILDPFMGSGTTGVACAKLGRKFVGIEIEPKYFDISCKRIEDAYAQPDMFIEPPAKAEQIVIEGIT